MKYNFDEIIDRKHTNCMNTDGFRQYIFHADETMKFPFADEEFIRMWTNGAYECFIASDLRNSTNF